MPVPEPLVKFLKHIRQRGIAWPLDPVAFPRPELHGTFIRKGDRIIRVMYDDKKKRFYLAQTDRTEPQEQCFFDHPDPIVAADHLLTVFP